MNWSHSQGNWKLSGKPRNRVAFHITHIPNAFALLGALVHLSSFVRKTWPPGSGRLFARGFMQPRALPAANANTRLSLESWTFTDADEPPGQPGVQQPFSLSILISLSSTYLTLHVGELVFTQGNGLRMWESHASPGLCKVWRLHWTVPTAPSALLFFFCQPHVLPHRPWHIPASAGKWSWRLWAERIAQ